MTISGKQKTVIAVISAIVGLIAAAVVGFPKKMYGGCGGHEIVALSATVQVIVNIAFSLLVAAGSAAVTFIILATSIRIAAKMNDDRLPEMTSGYRASLKKPKFFLFVSGLFPTSENILIVSFLGSFLPVMLIMLVGSNRYCPVNSNAALIAAFVVGVIVAVVVCVVINYTLNIANYDDGYHLTHKLREKARSCLPSMVQYYPMWAFNGKFDTRRNNVSDLKVFLKSSLPNEFKLITDPDVRMYGNGYVCFTLMYEGKPFYIWITMTDTNCVRIRCNAYNEQYETKEYECVASLMPAILDRIKN